MNSKPGFHVLNVTDPASDEPPVPAIYKRGWHTSVPTAEAIPATLAEVEKLYPGRTVVDDPEIVQTPEHAENDEYLVKVLIL